jgi:excisionase family DNA binding protein
MRAGYANPRKRTPGQGPVVRRKTTESRQNGDEPEKREQTVEERAPETTSDPDALLTPSEVAAMFRVNPKTVTRWARAGKISAIRTLGGHRRFRAAEIRRFLEQVEEGAETP